MDFQECVESKKCPSCGEKNGPGAARCGVCGADLGIVSVRKELETVAAVQESVTPWVQPPLPAEEPPPPAAAPVLPWGQPPPAENNEELKPSAPGASLDPFLKEYVLPFVAGAVLILILVFVGEKKEDQAPPATAVEAQDKGGEAMEIFMSHVLRNGADKGKTMRQYWEEYATAFQATRRKGDTSSLEVEFFQQAAGPGMHNIFVVEKVSREKDHLFPFSVDLAGREVYQAPGCVFAPGTEGKYAGAVCENSRSVFPEGL